MPTEDVEKIITSEVERHYREDDRPYYLAELGNFLSEQNIKIPAGIQLKEFLKKKLAGQVEIVQNQTVPTVFATHIAGSDRPVATGRRPLGLGKRSFGCALAAVRGAVGGHGPE